MVGDNLLWLIIFNNQLSHKKEKLGFGYYMLTNILLKHHHCASNQLTVLIKQNIKSRCVEKIVIFRYVLQKIKTPLKVLSPWNDIFVQTLAR